MIIFIYIAKTKDAKQISSSKTADKEAILHFLKFIMNDKFLNITQTVIRKVEYTNVYKGF